MRGVAWRSLPNVITGSRFVLILVLWVFALSGSVRVVGGGIVLAWLTDALDGFLARRLEAESALGSQLDSMADTLLFISALAWVFLLEPAFVQRHAMELGIWIGLSGLGYLVGWIRFRKVADVHLASAKLANFLGLFFAAGLLILGGYHPLVYWLVLGVCVWASLETLLVFLFFPEVDESIRTILARLRHRGT